MGRDDSYHHHNRSQHPGSNRTSKGYQERLSHRDSQSSFRLHRSVSQDISNTAPFDSTNFSPVQFQSPFGPSCPQVYEHQIHLNPLINQNNINPAIHLFNPNTIAYSTAPGCSGLSETPSMWLVPNVQEPMTSMPSATPQPLPNDFMTRLQLPPDQISEKGIIPIAPYYDLPAGLMVSVIPPSSSVYQPLSPKDLRLPLPRFPDESFLRTIDAFYTQDTEFRDSDGWDRTFIDSYLQQKGSY